VIAASAIAALLVDRRPGGASGTGPIGATSKASGAKKRTAAANGAIGTGPAGQP